MIRTLENQKVSTGSNDTVLYKVACITIEGATEIGCIQWFGHFWTISRQIGDNVWTINVERSAVSLEIKEILGFESKISRFHYPDVECGGADLSDFPPSYVERLRGSKHYGL